MKGAVMSKLTRALSANQLKNWKSVARRDRAPLFIAGARWIFAGALFVCAVALSSYAGTTSYVYDVHGRFTTVTTPNGSDQSITTNSYDNAGNRESVVIISAETTPPNPPTNLTATAQAFDRIRLNWTTSLDVGGGPVSYYRVYRGGTHIASPNGPPFDDWPLTASTTYSYTVSAVDPSGNVSTQSPSANATTPAAPDLAAPSVPTNLQGVAVSGTRVDLSWGASVDTGGSGLAGYEVFRNNGATPIGTSSTASYSDTTASVATTYSYKVRAYDGASNRSAFSNEITLTTPDTLAPSAPGALVFGSITSSTVTVSWTDASDNVGVTGYEYQVDGGAWSPAYNQLSVTITALTGSTTYQVYVRALDAAGNAGPPSSGQFTTNGLTWITISNGASVLPAHQGVYFCSEWIDMSEGTYHAWCYVASGAPVLDFWILAGEESWWWAAGYQGFLEVRSDYYGLP
jgi:chitodextrinase